MVPTPISLRHVRTVAVFGLVSLFCACGDDGTGPPDAAPFAMLTLGFFHTCGLTPEGKAYCWGQNIHGQLGDGTTTSRAIPVSVVGGLTFETLTAGGTHTCGITTEGATYCWGQNHRGQLGDGPVVQTPSLSLETIRSVPGLVPGGLQFVTLSLGGASSCGLVARGAAYCWGANWAGNFGNGKVVVDGNCALSGFSPTHTQPYCWSPVPAATGLILRTLESGSFHGCGLTLEARVYCWGDNDWGQLGDGTTGYSFTPIPVAGDRRYAELSGGSSYGCARTNDGVAYCWGVLPWGYLHDNFDARRPNQLYSPSTPTPVVAQQRSFRSISVGYEVACGLTDEGAAHCWGDNQFGQLGQAGTGPYRLNPEPILGGLTFRSIEAGYQRACGLTTDGAAYCWGLNDHGQLGDGTTEDRSLPVAVRGP
jgi:alpha-tubulin suppressor-like RCC1 family protein